MKCAKHILVGVIVAPVVAATIAAVTIGPAALANWFGFNPIWGFGVTACIFGGIIGGMNCAADQRRAGTGS